MKHHTKDKGDLGVSKVRRAVPKVEAPKNNQSQGIWLAADFRRVP